MQVPASASKMQATGKTGIGLCPWLYETKKKKKKKSASMYMLIGLVCSVRSLQLTARRQPLLQRRSSSMSSCRRQRLTELQQLIRLHISSQKSLPGLLQTALGHWNPLRRSSVHSTPWRHHQGLLQAALKAQKSPSRLLWAEIGCQSPLGLPQTAKGATFCQRLDAASFKRFFSA